MLDSKKKLLVFLSHANEDKPKVRHLCKQLRWDGFDPWLDEERLLPGQNWNLEIEKALRASDVVLLCLSTCSLQKEGFIQREYKRAMKYLEEKPEGTIFVIPVRLDEFEMPFFIQELQWVDYPDQYDRLVMALNQRMNNSDLSQVAGIPSQVQTTRVEIILEGEFSELTSNRQQNIVSILAALLRVESNQIRVVKVYQGSIVLIIEMPKNAAKRLYELAGVNDHKIMSLGIKSVLIEGREIIKLSDKPEQFDSGWEQLPNMGDSNYEVNANSSESTLQIQSSISKKADQYLFAPKIGIITALPEEFEAMKILLKNSKRVDFSTRRAGYRYQVGEIPATDGGRHIVALTLLLDMGNNSASSRATQLLEHFSSIDSIIMTGIAGGVPYPERPDEHVRLGDIVVSDRKGVIQYDLNKETKNEVEHRFAPRPPSSFLLQGVKFLRASEIGGKHPWISIIDQALKRLKVTRPSDDNDVLASTEDPKITIPHPKDPHRTPGQPRVFVGPIASANVLLKNPNKRDYLRDQFGVKAIEMEGSGVADATWNLEMGYLVVRGICDYCDSNKCDTWHQYAAIVAAAYTCALISSLPAQLTDMDSQIDESHEKRKRTGKVPQRKKRERWINGRYRMDGTLGKGSFGTVYKAYDKNLSTYVALKEKGKPFSVGENEEWASFSERFRREANTLSRLTHPNIASIQNFWMTKRSLYLVIPYFPGGTLASRLGKPIPYNNAAGLLVPIGKALAYAHKAGFIHRDVKPSNILFTDTNEPILTDFGLVKSLREDDLGITSDTGFIGTAEYAAPEQWQGEVCYQSDIYALGVIFYEMVTGHNPLDLKSLPERLKNPYLEKPSVYNPILPDIVDQVILHATARRLEDRYESMEEFTAELRKLAVGKVPAQVLSPKIPTAEKQEAVFSNEALSVREDRSGGEQLLSLVNKFEQQIHELILQKDFPNARRLLKVVERFGEEGQKVAQRLQDQLHA